MFIQSVLVMGMRAQDKLLLSRRLLLTLASGLLMNRPAAAAERQDEALAVAAVVAADEIRLADGRSLRLAGIQAQAGEAGRAAAEALAGWIAGQPLVLEPASPPLDRHGRLRAQARTAGGRWLQGELVGRGLALAAPAPDVPAPVLADLLALERAVRAAKRGLWAAGRHGPLPAERAAAGMGDYVLVTGRVLSVAPAQSFVYLNFGDDWRRDFTVRATKARARSFAREGLDLARLAGRNLLVRGWLFAANGPMIELVHPAQIEVAE